MMLKCFFISLLMIFSVTPSYAFWGPNCNSAYDCMNKGSQQQWADKAAEFYAEACDEYDYAEGCFATGYNYNQIRKYIKALKYFSKGCKMNHPASCQFKVLLSH